MSKEFVCKLDKMIFNSAESLHEHILSSHIKKNEKKSCFSDNFSYIQEQFPDCVVSMYDDSSFFSKFDYDLDNMYEPDIFVTLKPFEFDFLFVFAVTTNGSVSSISHSDTLTLFPSAQDAVSFYRYFLDFIHSFPGSLLSFLKEYDTSLQKIEVHKIDLQRDKYNSIDYHISFVFHNTNGEADDLTTLTFSTEDILSNSLDDIGEKLRKRLSGRYIDVLEGDVTIEDHIDWHDHYQEYLVNGVNIDDLARRAKILRVTILEEKEII